MKTPNSTYNGKDLTMNYYRTKQQGLGLCLQDLATIGFIDTNSIGCASSVVLYLSLVLIFGVVAIRFIMAVVFQWFFSWKLGNFPRETNEQRMPRLQAIEDWSNDIYRPSSSALRPKVNKNGLRPSGKDQKRKTFLPSCSCFTPAETLLKSRPTTAYGMLDSSSAINWKRSTMYSSKTGKGDTNYRTSRSTMSLPETHRNFPENQCRFPLINVVSQPPPGYELFDFPLAHTVCLVTVYSESVEDLRTALDSLATTP